MKNFILLLSTLLLSACLDAPVVYAPVMDVNGIDPIPKAGMHPVLAHETLYEIAWRYGLDYRDLAAINHIQPPYVISAGQVIYLRAPNVKNQQISKEKLQVESDIKEALHDRPGYDQKSHSAWYWPARGRVIRKFAYNNKGINIAGRYGAPVFAAAKGTVVYAGDGLRAYGNLILIKHNNLYISAYAYNKAVYVKEGQIVASGQRIAAMGGQNGQALLHFEIRRAGQPVDPLTLLSKNS